MKAGAISLAIAAVLAIFLSWWLELSPKGITAITTLSIVVFVAIGQLLRVIWPSKSKDEDKKNPDS
jgi:hypothetical protein